MSNQFAKLPSNRGVNLSAITSFDSLMTDSLKRDTLCVYYQHDHEFFYGDDAHALYNYLNNQAITIDVDGKEVKPEAPEAIVSHKPLTPPQFKALKFLSDKTVGYFCQAIQDATGISRMELNQLFLRKLVSVERAAPGHPQMYSITDEGRKHLNGIVASNEQPSF